MNKITAIVAHEKNYILGYQIDNNYIDYNVDDLKKQFIDIENKNDLKILDWHKSDFEKIIAKHKYIKMSGKIKMPLPFYSYTSIGEEGKVTIKLLEKIVKDHKLKTKTKPLFLPMPISNGYKEISFSSFAQNLKLNSIDFTNLKTELVSDMSYMFKKSAFKILNFSSLDTKNVTNMRGMFEGYSGEEIDLAGIDTKNVTDMSDMFKNCTAKIINIESLDTTNVTNMSGMFNGYSGGDTLDLSNFNLTNVTDLSGMFFASNLENIQLPKTKNRATNMSSMFSSCAVNNINIQDLYTGFAENMAHMFNFSLIKFLDLSNFNTSNVTDMNNMFNNCRSTGVDISSFNTSRVVDMSHMFSRCKSIYIDLSVLDTSSVRNMQWMFASCKLPILYLLNFNLENLELDNSNNNPVAYMFNHCYAKEVYMFDCNINPNFYNFFELYITKCCDEALDGINKAKRGYNYSYECTIIENIFYKNRSIFYFNNIDFYLKRENSRQDNLWVKYLNVKPLTM